MSDSRSLSGKIALVTGGARGIGRGIALRLAANGCAVAVADLHPQPFQGERYHRLREGWSGPEEEVSTAKAVQELGVDATEIQVDVSDAESVGAAVATCEAQLGSVDVLVNNAGIVNNIASIAKMSADAWEQEIGVNLTGAFHCIQATVPAMAERGWGRVINIASVAARSPTAVLCGEQGGVDRADPIDCTGVWATWRYSQRRAAGVDRDPAGEVDARAVSRESG